MQARHRRRQRGTRQLGAWAILRRSPRRAYQPLPELAGSAARCGLQAIASGPERPYVSGEARKPDAASEERPMGSSLVLALALLTPAAVVEDLAKHYPATLTWSEQGLFCHCDPTDVWQLKSYEAEFGKDFAVSCGPATVALGVSNTNVLWAVLFPEEPAKIRF